MYYSNYIVLKISYSREKQNTKILESAMEKQPSKSEKFGKTLRRSYPYYLLVGPLLFALEARIIGAVLLGIGLYFMAIDLSEKK